MKTSSNSDWDIPLEEVKWRPVGRPSQRKEIRYAAYPDARVVQKHLDDVFGWDGWQTEFFNIEGGIMCKLSVWSEERNSWVVKSDGSENTAMSATKGGISGALRRVAAQLGVGRNIYDLPEVWGPYVESNGKYYAPFGVEKELVKRARALMKEGAPAIGDEDDDDDETPGPVNSEPTEASPASEFAQFLARFEKLPKARQGLLQEWWAKEYPDKGAPTEASVGTDAFAKLLMRLDMEEEPF